MRKVPPAVAEVSSHLYREGFRRAEAYPVERWRRQGWPESPEFFRAVDSCLRLEIALETYENSITSGSI